MKNKRVLLAKTPDSSFPENIDFFHFKEEIIDLSENNLKGGELIVRNLFISIEPVTRVWISGAKTYLDPVLPGDPIPSFAIAKVVSSKAKEYQPGEIVMGVFRWETFTKVYDAKKLLKIPEVFKSFEKLQLQNFLSVLGPTGLTSYLGLKDANPKVNETVVVSAAAGAVGSIVIQLAKLWGCRAVGIAGTDEKCRKVVDVFGADACLNYNKLGEELLSKELRKACPKGVDIFFDNVGETSLDAGLACMNDFGRVIMCGAMATYSKCKNYKGLKNYNNIISKRLLLQGILYFGKTERILEAFKGLMPLIIEGKLKFEEQIVDGVEKGPEALQSVYKGLNKGKIIIKVENEEICCNERAKL